VPTKLPFWASFIIREAITFVQAFVAGNTQLTDQQKTDLETFISQGTKLLADFGVA